MQPDPDVHRKDSPPPLSADIDVFDSVRELWKSKWLVCGITFAFAVTSILIVLWLPNVYRAEARLAPNDNRPGSDISTLSSRYGGLAALAGINLSSDRSDQIALGLEILQSRQFVAEFVASHDLLVPLIAGNGWDYETRTLEIDDDIYDIEEEKWVRKVRPPRKQVPSSQEAYKEFSDRLIVDRDKGTGVVTISFDFYSPDLASEWVTLLIHDLNQTVMRKDVKQAQDAIDFLNSQARATSLAGLQTVFFSLIEDQTKTVMLARISDEYLLQTIDPAVAPEKKRFPKRALIVALSTLLGFLVSSVAVILAKAARTRRAMTAWESLPT